MKYIKTYEALQNNTFEKGDIVLRPGTYSYSLHLLLQNVNESDVWIKEFQIGVIGTNVNNIAYAILVFNRDTKKQIMSFRNNTKDFLSFRHLTQPERDLIYNSIKNGQYDIYLDIVKKDTGIDLREKEDYKNWLIEQEAKKYNL
jgi:hypothetical protein